jgi:MFS family permease
VRHVKDQGQDPPPIETATRVPRWLRPVESLYYRDFRLLWGTSFLSSAAKTIQQISLGWLAFDLSGSPLLLGTVMFVYDVPFLTTAPFIGVLVDRFDRRRLLIVSQLGMALVASLLAVDIAMGTIQSWHLLIFALASGVENTLIHVVRQALVPSMVPKRVLLNAITVNSAAFTVSRTMAPLIGGVLIVAFGVSGNFVIQAVLLIGVALAAFPMRMPEFDRSADEKEDGAAPVLKEIAEGLRFIWNNGVLRELFAVRFVIGFVAMPITIFLPAWAAEVLDLDADGLGILYSAMGIGALLGTVLLAAAGNVKRKGLLLAGISAGMALSLMGLSQASGMTVSLLVLGLIGAMQTVFFAVSMTLVQLQVPQRLQGRVMSIYNMGHGAVSAGALVMGVIAEVSDVQVAVVILGAAALVTTVVGVVWLPSMRKM